MKAEVVESLRQQVGRIFAERSKEKVSDWCKRVLQLAESDNRGPFMLVGREYIREWLDSLAEPHLSDFVMVTGSQVGKTTALMALAAWIIRHESSRIFWVMPTRDTMRNFSRTRWMPLLRTSGFEVPEGYDRFHFSTFEQIIEGSIVDMVWSNSPAALSSVPARVVILDEIDKFSDATAQEANAVDLALQRTKSAANPKRLMASTPTLGEGLIWQQFLRTDQRRYFVPCPHCGKECLLVWQRGFCVFPNTGHEAYIAWDQGALRDDESWDLERVEQSAHAVCPHCQGRIEDRHKGKMLREGVWRPTQPGSPGFRGWHLSSLYSTRPECGFGKLAVKFLLAKRSVQGVQGFINGDLAEPWENQESLSARVELVVEDDARPIEKAFPILTVDHQHRAPQFWYVVREWNQHSRLTDWGTASGFEQLREVQLKHGIRDEHVFLDSGHAATEIYQNCLRFGKIVRLTGYELHCGWTPCKGFGRQHWVTKDGARKIYHLTWAALPSSPVRVPLMEFATNPVKDILQRLRRRKTDIRWEVPEKLGNEVYWRHLDAEKLKEIVNPRTGRTKLEWCLRSRYWPNHLFDCEVMQIAAAILTGGLRPEQSAELTKDVDWGDALREKG